MATITIEETTNGLNITEQVTTLKLGEYAVFSGDINDLNQVETTSLAEGDLLQYNSTSGVFENVADDVLSIEKGSLTKTFTASEEYTMTLDSAIAGVPIVGATKEIAGVTDTDSTWNVETSGGDYDVEDFALDTTLTPSATTGDITLTLGANSFTADNVGMTISGNGGVCVLTAIDGSATTTTDFTDTSAIASGSWTMEGLVFDATNGVTLSLLMGGIDGAVYTNTTSVQTQSLAFSNGDILIAFADSSNSSYGTFMIIASDGTVTKTATVFNAGTTTEISLALFGNGNIGISYRDDGNGGNGTIVIVNSSGSIIVNETVFNASTSSDIASASFSNGNVVIAYRDFGNSYYGTYLVINSSGTIVVSEATLVAGTNDHCKASTLGNGNVLVAYADSSNSNYGTFQIINSSGTIVVSSTVFNSASVTYISTSQTSNGNVLIAYRDGGNSSYGTFVVVDSSGTIVVSKTVFNAGTTSYISTASSGSSEDILIAYKDDGNSNYGTYMIVDEDGTTITPPTVFNEATTDTIATATWENGNVLIAHRDGGNSYYGTYAVYSPTGDLAPINQYFPAITNASGQIDTSLWLDIDDVTVDDVAGGSVTSADVSVSSYDTKSFSFASQDATPVSATFNDDGTKMYIMGRGNDTIYQYTLSTAFDVSTASYASKSLSVLAVDASNYAVQFKSDGTKLYFLGSKKVYQYTLSTAWDVNTGTYDSAFATVDQDIGPSNMFLKQDGLKLYVLGGANPITLFQYTLSTAWDISTCTYDSISFNVGAVESCIGFTFNSDGTKMFTAGLSSIMHQYSLSTAWDIGTASYDSNTFNTSTQESAPRSIVLNNDDTKMYMSGSINKTIYQYTLGSDSIYSGDAYYAISNDDKTTFYINQSGSTERSITRDNAGTWEYNSSADYGIDTWTSATTNTVYGALKDAMSVSANQMTGSELDALADSEQITIGDTLDLAIILHTTDATVNPSSDGASVDYTASATYGGAINGTDYEWEKISDTQIKITGLTAGNYNVRAV